MKLIDISFPKKIMSFLMVGVTILTAAAYTENKTVPAQKVTDHYVQLSDSDNVKLFYHDSGKGQVIVFIPGWTMTSEIFKAQMTYFNKKYRVITLDPRSQGRSSVTLENNDYTQHGADLAHFLDALKLKKVTLVAWSWGCYDAYAYIRLKGVSNLRAFVCVDASPKSSGRKDEWGGPDYPDWGTAIVQPVMYNRYHFTQAWAQLRIERKLTPAEQEWIVQESFHTPTYAALQLILDAIYADYRPEAKLLNSCGIPTLDFVAQHFTVNATRWLHTNAPNANIKIMDQHFMFWEQPDEFNQTLSAFLDSIETLSHQNLKKKKELVQCKL